MAPIPVYTNSPITAAKADGVTPKTAPVADATCKTSQASSTPTPTSSYTPSTYAAARPGAVPSLPIPTASAASQPYSPPQPTPTTSIGNASPAPPQPGSVPVSGLPPPPRAGERYQMSAGTPAPPTATTRIPPQMAIPAPMAPQPSQYRGTSTAAMASSSPYGSQMPPGTMAIGGDGAQSFSHPAGYHQNANASTGQHDLDDGGNGIWGAAKKLAQQTGERLVAAETEVWKKINKE